MIGIYKITSPTGKIYIGESQDIKKRWLDYKCLDCKQQIRLYNSLKFHGVENHKFEIMTLCYFEQLKLIEREFQEAYDVIGVNGLNCKLTGTDEKKEIVSEETRLKMSISRKNRIMKPFTEEHCKNIGLSQLGQKRSEESRKRMSETRKGIIFSETHLLNLSLSHKGIAPKTTKRFKRKVLQFENEVLIKEWDSLRDAALFYNINESSISHACAGRKKLIKGYSWKYLE